MKNLTLKEAVLKFVTRRRVSGVNYRDIEQKFPGTRAERYLREMAQEGLLYAGWSNGRRTFFR